MQNNKSQKKSLFIFDHSVNVATLHQYIPRESEIDIFPLTGNWSIINRIQDACNKSSGRVARLIISSKMINEQIDNLRPFIIKLSEIIGDFEIENKTVKEHLLLPDKSMSTWWFGIIADKNPYKVDLYLQLAQVMAIKTQLKITDYNYLYLVVEPRLLRKAVIKLAKGIFIPCTTLPLNRSWKTRKSISIKNSLENFNLTGGMILSLASLARYYTRGVLARLAMGNKVKRLVTDSILFVTFFPYVDDEDVKNGRFKNKLVSSLQERIEESGKPLTWLLMVTSKNQWPWSKALRLARKFVKSGEKIYVVEEFFTLKAAMKSYFLWMHHIIKCLKIENKIAIESIANELLGSYSALHLKSLLRKSFYHPSVMKGIISQEMFRNLFGTMEKPGDCIYICEFQDWEKAMNTALKKSGKCKRSIGFQHTSLSRNVFRYYYTPKEILRLNGPTDLPLPDVIACNGKVSFNILKRTGFPNVVQVEAVRQLNLAKEFDKRVNRRSRKKIIFVACPFNRQEARDLISLVNTAFPRTNMGFDIWFKGHPYTPLDGIFRDMGIDCQGNGFSIKHGNVNDYLKSAFAVIVSSSTVSIEALLAGCEVFVPFFSNSICINPIYEFNNYYYEIHSPEELREKINHAWNKKSIDFGINERVNFGRGYWHLDSSLVKWEKLLFDESGCKK